MFSWKCLKILGTFIPVEKTSMVLSHMPCFLSAAVTFPTASSIQLTIPNNYILKILKKCYLKLSKICIIPFWPSCHRCEKCVDIWKAPSGGRAEIESVTQWAFFYVFNFSSATREQIWNVNTVQHLWPLGQKVSYIFLTDYLVIWLWSKTCQGVWFFSVLAPYLAITLDR